MSRKRQSQFSFRPTLEALEDRWVPANVGTPNQNFVDQLYRDVLHRAPDPASSGWVAALNTGTERGKIVDGILNSDEGRRNQVNDLYVRFLGRTAEQGGLTFWTNFLRDHSNLELATNIIASQEYYVKAGGTNQGFLNQVYLDVLGRPITASDLSRRDDDFSHGVSSRAEVADHILESNEGRDNRDFLSVRSYLRQTVSQQQARDIVDSDDNGGGRFNNDDAVFSGTLLSGNRYYQLSQTLTTADFATIPSTNNVAAQPALAPGATGTGP